MQSPPLDIPGLMSFGTSRDQKVRTTAREAIQHLFAKLPFDQLLSLDASMRRMWWLGGFTKPQDVRSLGGPSEADRLFVALLTCDWSGHVRAEALRHLSTHPSPIDVPFILMRLADWVAPVAALAEAEFRKRLHAGNADMFVDCLGLVARLSAQARYRHEHTGSIENLLRSPECAPALQHGMRAPSRLVRRHCVRLALENSALAQSDTLELALADDDVLVRRWAYSMGVDPIRAARDPYAPIRKLAFEAAAERGADLTRYLLDPSARIRRDCQALGSAQLGLKPADFYRIRLQGSRVAILGLAETGDRSDGPAIAALLVHPQAGKRRAAVRALSRLGVENDSDFLRIVATDRPSVARVAVLALLRRVPLSRIWEAALENPDTDGALVVLRSMTRAHKWHQLSIYLEAAKRPELLSATLHLLQRWLQRYNHTWIQPSTAELASLQAQLDRSSLPEKLAHELRFLLLHILT